MGMRNFIAAVMSILGILLVLAGAGIIILPAVAKRGATEAGSGADPTLEPGGGSMLDRSFRRLSRLGPSDRLIVWGIVLLVVAAIAAGAIGFSLNATATGK